MGGERESLKPVEGANRKLRRRLGLCGELALALLPTLVVLGVFGFVEVVSRQQLLFASLASSAFLIYLDPHHATNTARTLAISHLLAATIGLLTSLLFGHGYAAGGTAMVLTILLMILLDVVHPPAVSTSLSFALRAGSERDIVLFVLAVAVMASLVVMQRLVLWTLARLSKGRRD